jgi:hypothetical protein
VTVSVVIDGRLDATRAHQAATLVQRLGLARVWLRQPWWPLTGPGPSDAEGASLPGWLAASAPARAGLIVDASQTDPGWLDRIAQAGPPGDGEDRRPADISIALSGAPAAISRWQRSIARGPGLAIAQLALPATASAPGGRGTALATAVFVPCSPGRDLAAEVSAAAAAAAGRPVLAEVTVSVGRTMAEAQARADADELFMVAGHPAQQGLFGTLEECQAAASRLAHAGATELVCYLPLASDLADILAQLRSIAIGAGVLRPGEPPSAAPPPPDGWGGRSVTPLSLRRTCQATPLSCRTPDTWLGHARTKYRPMPCAYSERGASHGLRDTTGVAGQLREGPGRDHRR